MFATPKELVTDKDGNSVFFPESRMSPIPEQIAHVGIKAVTNFVQEKSESDRMYNIAKHNYIQLRSKLVDSFNGKWAAVSNDNDVIIGTSEFSVRMDAEKRFPMPVAEYYCNCIGREIQELAFMDSSAATG